MVYVVQVCRQLAVRKLSANLYDIYHCCVYSEKTPDDGQRNCPETCRVLFQNKFEKLVHLVGFIIRFYYDARSTERQIRQKKTNFKICTNNKHNEVKGKVIPLQARCGPEGG